MKFRAQNPVWHLIAALVVKQPSPGVCDIKELKPALPIPRHHLTAPTIFYLILLFHVVRWVCQKKPKLVPASVQTRFSIFSEIFTGVQCNTVICDRSIKSHKDCPLSGDIFILYTTEHF